MDYDNMDINQNYFISFFFHGNMFRKLESRFVTKGIVIIKK